MSHGQAGVRGEAMITRYGIEGGAIYALSADLRAAGVRAALQSSHLDLRVRAAELLAVRHDERLVDPMRALLADKDLARTIPLVTLTAFRHRAAEALATLGAPSNVRFFTELLKDEDTGVREQAARGVTRATSRLRHGAPPLWSG